MGKKKETEQEVQKVNLSVEEYQGMLREEELMKETLRVQTEKLNEAKEDLKTVKKELLKVTRDLCETKDMLHSAIRLQTKAEDAADLCIETLKGNLNHWLSKKNRVYINKLMGYHPKDRQVIFFQAIMDYLLFGVKPNLPTETLKVHFENVCKRIDEDAITLPAHSLMVKLVKKYGLFEKVIEN